MSKQYTDTELLDFLEEDLRDHARNPAIWAEGGDFYTMYTAKKHTSLRAALTEALSRNA